MFCRASMGQVSIPSEDRYFGLRATLNDPSYGINSVLCQVRPFVRHQRGGSDKHYSSAGTLLLVENRNIYLIQLRCWLPRVRIYSTHTVNSNLFFTRPALQVDSSPNRRMGWVTYQPKEYAHVCARRNIMYCIFQRVHRRHGSTKINLITPLMKFW